MPLTTSTRRGVADLIPVTIRHRNIPTDVALPSSLPLAEILPAVAARLRPGSARVAGTDDDVPSGLTRSEVKGFLEGPVRYLRSRHANRLRPRKRPSSGRADGAEGAPEGPGDGRG